MRLRFPTCRTNALRSLGGFLLASLLTTTCAAQSQQPSLFGDPRVREWSQLNLDHKFEEALASVERDLLSPAPEPLAWNVWVWLHLDRGDLREATKALTPELRRALGTAPDVALAYSVNDSAGMQHLVPSYGADAQKSDLWTLLELSMATRDTDHTSTALGYAIAAGRKRPDSFMAAWLTMNAIEAMNKDAEDQALSGLKSSLQGLEGTPYAQFCLTLIAESGKKRTDDTYLRWADAWLEKVPDDADAWYFRVDHLMAGKQYDRAVESYRKAAQLYSFRAHWQAMAANLFRAGRDADAEALLAQGAAIASPGDAHATQEKWAYDALISAGRVGDAEKRLKAKPLAARLVTQADTPHSFIAFTNDATLMASCGPSSPFVTLWDVASGRQLAQLDPVDQINPGGNCEAAGGMKQTLWFSDDGQVVFVRMSTKQFDAFSTTTHKLIGRWEWRYSAFDVQPVPGTHALAMQSGFVGINDFVSPVASIPCKYDAQEQTPTGFRFSPDGRLVLMLCQEGLTLYDRTAARVLWRRPLSDYLAKLSAGGEGEQGRSEYVGALALLPDGRAAITHANDVQLISLSDGSLLQTSSLRGEESLYSLIPTAGWLNARRDDGSIWRWQVTAAGLGPPELVRREPGDSVLLAGRLPAWPPGQYEAREGQGQAELIEQLGSDKPVARLTGSAKDFDRAVFLGAGRLLLFDQGEGPRPAALWKFAGTSKHQVDVPVKKLCGPFAVTQVAPTGVAGAGSVPANPMVTLVDPATAGASAALPATWVKTCSSDGRIAAGFKSERLVVRDLASNQVILDHAAPLMGSDPLGGRAAGEQWGGILSLSPDGSLIAFGGKGNTGRDTGNTLRGDTPLSLLKVWRNATGEEIPLKELVHAGVSGGLVITGLIFSKNNRWLAAAIAGRGLHLVDLSTGVVAETTIEGSFDFSADSTSLFYGDESGLMRQRDLKSGDQLDVWQASDSSIEEVTASPDGKLLVTIDRSGLVRLWDAETHQLKVTLTEFTDGTWAVTDQKGRYDAANPDESIGLHWVAGNRVIELQQLKREFYTPNLLARVLAGEHLPDVTGMDSVALPPVLTLARDFDPVAKKLTISLRNDGGGVGRLSVRVNGRLLRTVEKPGTAPADQSFPLVLDLGNAPFVAGDNAIRVTAYDAGNRIESQELVAHYTLDLAPRGFPVKPGAASPAPSARFYGVIVGTSVFGGPKVPNLQFPAKDAQSIATGLRLGAEGLYGKDKVWMRVLTSNYVAGDPASGDGLPTKQNIRAAFDEVRRLAKPEDTLVVYLSGHGVMSTRDRDLYYYLTADARGFDLDDGASAALKDASAVSSAELFEWLREPVKTMPLKQVVILDTCAAGGASDALGKLAVKRDIPPDQRRAMELLKDGTGTFILMGSAADQVSYEASRYSEGLLTYALLEGMRGAAIKDASRLDVSAWFATASDRVPKLAEAIGGIQRPVTAAPRGKSFPIGLLTASDQKRIPLAVAVPQLLRVLCVDDKLKDGLNLRDPLRGELRSVNDVSARGTGAGSVNYLDATDDDLPGALSPRLQYKVTGNTVTVHLLLTSGDTTVAESNMTTATGNTPELAKMLAARIVAMAVAAKP